MSFTTKQSRSMLTRPALQPHAVTWQSSTLFWVLLPCFSQAMQVQMQRRAGRSCSGQTSNPKTHGIPNTRCMHWTRTMGVVIRTCAMHATSNHACDSKPEVHNVEVVGQARRAATVASQQPRNPRYMYAHRILLKVPFCTRLVIMLRQRSVLN
jgi:hypothetical protein